MAQKIATEVKKDVVKLDPYPRPPTEEQIKLDKHYEEVVQYLKEKGIDATYNKYWLMSDDTPVGYITLTKKRDN